jgi:hypothetical protein
MIGRNGRGKATERTCTNLFIAAMKKHSVAKTNKGAGAEVDTPQARIVHAC